MTAVKYRGVEVEVRAGGSGGEAAFATLDGERFCFLGGLAEAKVVIALRRAGPYLGPRRDSYEIRLDGRTYASSSGMSRENAYQELDYWRREGRRAALVRTEHCPEPGCDGHGQVSYQRRGSKWVSHRACANHREPEEVIEAEIVAAQVQS